MPVVRTTMEPDREIEVSNAEYTDLNRQGLLVPEKAPARNSGKPVDKKEGE